ncbi:MAG: leucine-rich repeat domain-containing protein, partial [Raoultibacter sp.]
MVEFRIENGTLLKYRGKGGAVVVPEGVTSIGGGAFYGCSSLTSITIPEGVTSIGQYAFRGC